MVVGLHLHLLALLQLGGRVLLDVVVVVEELIRVLGFADALAEEADEESADEGDADGDGESDELESALPPPVPGGDHLDGGVGVVGAVGRGSEENGGVDGSDEGGHEEDEERAEGIEDSFGVEGLQFAVQEGGEHSHQEADEQGGEGVGEDVGTGSVGDGSLNGGRVTEKQEKITSWTEILPRIQMEVAKEEEALALRAQMMLRGATCLKSGEVGEVTLTCDWSITDSQGSRIHTKMAPRSAKVWKQYWLQYFSCALVCSLPMTHEATNPAVDPNKKILIPQPLSLMASLQKETSLRVYAKLPTKQMTKASPGPTLPRRGNMMTYMAMAQATACASVKYNISAFSFDPCTRSRPDRRMLQGLSPSFTILVASPRLMAYQNFLTRKYHWIVKASMMKLSTSPLMENSLRQTESSPKPEMGEGVPMRSSMTRKMATNSPLKSEYCTVAVYPSWKPQMMAKKTYMTIAMRAKAWSDCWAAI